MLRDSLRGLLEHHGSGAGPDIWPVLVRHGIASLGTEPSEGGLREALVVMEELGRAARPAPMLGALLANLAHWPHDESARIAVALGAFDRAPNAGTAVLSDGRLSGRLRFVEGAASATHLLVATHGGLAVSAAGSFEARATRALGAEGLYDVELSSAPAQIIDLPRPRIDDLRLVVQLCLHARAHGAARRAFEMAVEYAKERHQFGKPIGSFQAIQHKLANCLISLEGVRRTLENAATNYDRGEEHWRYFANAALAYGGAALRQTSLETHHTFGAIGYAEEHEAPRHFRRVHADTLAHGASRAAREALASHFLDHADGTLPRYDLGARGNAFREEVRAWLAQHWSGARKGAFDSRPFHEREYDPDFARDLGKTGWIGLSWPTAYGGQARSPLEQIAYTEEMERADAPRAGAPIQANALIQFGTAEQQRRYLPEILRGEAIHGMGYSEPNAGSDLAALRTSAVRDGDEWVINGQKIWTTTYWGQYMFLGARTDAKATPKHAGISTFIVPMNAPGITIKPSRTMYDGSFANIFYDDVRLPADALLGRENGGWNVLTSALATERGLVGGGIVLKVARQFELFCAEIRNSSLATDVLARDHIGRIAAEVEVGRQLMMQCAELSAGGVTPPEYAAISKVFSGELMERFGETALELLGMHAALSQEAAGNLQNGRFEQGLRHSLMWVISIGTNEIQRSLIAHRALGLPR
jgi:alkylation response protein AidB-like acyl-CoA dehydrogenase